MDQILRKQRIAARVISSPDGVERMAEAANWRQACRAIA
jgi:hypothetical protein